MEQIHLVAELFRLVILVALALLFMNKFRGGRPPRPMHPSPANDDAMLKKRRSSARSGPRLEPSSCVDNVRGMFA